MKEVRGNIWDFHNQGHWIVITTNGTVRKDGACVMGRGVAKQAADKFPKIPYILGERLMSWNRNNHVQPLDITYRIICFPVKHNWRDAANLELISRSCAELVTCIDNFEVCCPDDFPAEGKIYMVRPGCGNGQLDWKDVKPILEKYLDDRFIVVEIASD